MELKLVQVPSSARWTTSSNRTFMELKLKWDKLYPYDFVRSNRTFMELKLLITDIYTPKDIQF